ncbi:MAG: carboxypeptidase regulatory-like domain-containing protein [Clostridia bacterium]|nr:carboxypeptidase regulatory-like domain-containing protein [Clostridia bacterium]
MTMARILGRRNRGGPLGAALLLAFLLVWADGFRTARMAAPQDFTVSNVHYGLSSDGNSIRQLAFEISPADTGPLWVWFSSGSGPVGTTPYYSESGGDCRRTGNQVLCDVNVPVRPPTQLNVLVAGGGGGGGGNPAPPPATVLAPLPPPTGGGGAAVLGEIWGQVRFLDGGPATDAEVGLDSSAGTALTSAGTYRFTGVGAGTHSVVARLAGYRVVQVVVDGQVVSGDQAAVEIRRDGQSVEVDFVLAPAGQPLNAPQPTPRGGPGGLAFTGGNFDPYVLAGAGLILASLALWSRRLRRHREADGMTVSGHEGT